RRSWPTVCFMLQPNHTFTRCTMRPGQLPTRICPRRN
ncbi:uncharacterized protein METZ01_LOCUS156516, partial [marine metagenome]